MQSEANVSTWRRVAIAAEFSSALAAAFYAYGWVAVAMALGRFDVSPEEVGIGFGYLATRAAPLIVAFGVVLAAAVAIGRWFGSFDLVIRFTRRWDKAAAATLIIISLIAASATIASAASSLVAISAPVVAALSGLVSGLLQGAPQHATHRATDAAPPNEIPRMSRRRPDSFMGWSSDARLNLGPWVQRIWGLVVVILVAGFIISPSVIARNVSNQIEHGKPVSLAWLPGVPALIFRSVSVSAIDGAAGAPKGCVLLLGSSDGVDVLYDSESSTVHRLPHEHFVLVSPCEPAKQGSLVGPKG